MSQYSGVLKIVRFNWPWYATAVGATILGIALIHSGVLNSAWEKLAIAGLITANFWMLASLAVSHYVYDRSPVARGDWLRRVDANQVQQVAIFHAGQDEASPTVEKKLRHAKVERFDFIESGQPMTPSLQRARALSNANDRAIVFNTMPLADSTIDLSLVVFAAHEIRHAKQRTAFFRELARVLSPAGTLLVVEHLCDIWNLLAFGPGAFHFFSRGTWCANFRDAGLVLLHEETCTPFVRVFQLEKPQ